MSGAGLRCGSRVRTPPVTDGTVAIIGGEVRQRAVATLVAAFIADPVERWLYPSSFEYLAHFGRFIESFAGRAFEVGTAWSAADLSAVALWLPPGTAPDEDAVGRMLSETVAPKKQADTFATLEQMADAHPTSPHWYLALMGVDPQFRGLGLGARLIEAGLRTVDADQLPAYLETPNPKAIPLYERYGFTVAGQSQAGSCPPLTSMIRAAR